MKTIIFMVAMVASISAASQNIFKAYLKDAKEKEVLIGATALLEGTTNGSSADVNGYVEIKNIPDGKHVIVFRFVGYEERKDTFLFPMGNEPIEILLEELGEELEEVTVTATRSSRTIADEPTRIEAITLEELDEKSNMKPGDIRMLLSESTGIQTQQTSATTANSGIRIQGLDGRYTQILKDGFPLYSGFSGGLSIMQIPPLDLKQVEVIKGSASTLYGGGAIAGLINLVSKTPGEKKELSFHLNGTSAKGFDASGFYSKRFKKVGLTLFSAYNGNMAYDPAGIDLSAIPQFQRITFNPKLFIYFTDKTTLNFGVNTGYEDRLGGDMHYIKGESDSVHSYFEKNITNRYSTQLAFDHKFGKCSHLGVKNSVSYFNRKTSIPGYSFEGLQLSSFSEVTYASHDEKVEWITGLNAWTDQFNESQLDSFPKRDYSQNTYGLFVQNTWNAAEWFTLETGIRGDYVQDYKLLVLPRLSALFKISPKLTSRIGGGFGYKPPTIFTEEAEEVVFRNILPIDPKLNRVEESIGGNFDMNYRTGLFKDKVTFSINQMFFYTRLNKPLVLESDTAGILRFINANGHIDTKGIETNIKIGYRDFKLFLGYTLTDTKRHFNDTLTEMPLTAKHRVNSVLMYEVEEKWRVGLEAYYFSPQKLNDGKTGRDYWNCGFMVERIWERMSIYINFENFLDARQTRFDSIYTGTVTNPQFRDIYAPLDGRVINGGIKIKL